MTQILRNGSPRHSGDRKTFEMMTSTSVASLLAAILYQRNPDKEPQALEYRIN
jgi:hypothetical protein